MTEGNYYPPASQPAPEKKPSLWQRFKRWPMLAKIATLGCGGLVAVLALLLALGAILWAVDPDGMQEIVDEQEQERLDREAEREAEEEAEREAEEAAREAEEEEEEEEEPEESPSPSPSPTPTPELSPEPTEEEEAPLTFDEKLEELSSLSAFDDASAYFSEGDDSYPVSAIYVDEEVAPGLTTGTMCNGARDATIKALEYVRDNIDEDYDELRFSFVTRGQEDATGDAPIVGMATVVYERETVESIDSDAISLINVWETRDEGSVNSQCN